jgi:hypothetical protein
MELKVGEVNRTHGYNCQTIARSISLHFVRFISHANNVLLVTKEFSCFCDKCVDDIVEGDCDSKLHVSLWTLLTLQPCNSSYVDYDIETYAVGWGNDGNNNDLVMDLEMQDNFAIKVEASNVEEIEFYVVQCDMLPSS